MAQLRRHKIKGWRRHPRHVPGAPDFYFAKSGVALFVDGCFWHGCPRCGHIPKSNLPYWDAKIARNIRRDAATRRLLRKQGFHTMRLWEHEVRGERWMNRLRKQLGIRTP